MVVPNCWSRNLDVIDYIGVFQIGRGEGFARGWPEGIRTQCKYWYSILRHNRAYLTLSLLQSSHPTWTTLKTWNFGIFFSRPGKCMEFAQKSVKTWNFNSKPWKTWNLQCYVLSFTFQDVIYKNNSDLHLCNMYIINTNIVIRSQIDHGFHCFYLEITWKIHGILCH